MMLKTEAAPAIPPLMLRAKDAAKACGLSISTWYNLMSQGRIAPSLKIGKARLWRADILRRWVLLDCPTIERFEALLAEEGAKR